MSVSAPNEEPMNSALSQQTSQVVQAEKIDSVDKESLPSKNDTSKKMDKLPITSLPSTLPAGMVKMKQEGRAKMTAPSKSDSKQSETLMKMAMSKEASSGTKEPRLLNRPLPTTMAQMDNLKSILNSVMKTSISQVLRHKIDKAEDQVNTNKRESVVSEPDKQENARDDAVESGVQEAGGQHESDVGKNESSLALPRMKHFEVESEQDKPTATLLKDSVEQVHKARKGSPSVAHKTLFARNTTIKVENVSSPSAANRNQISPAQVSKKRLKKRPFKGATYDLYLSKKHKKKHSKRELTQPEPSGILKDDESSLAGTETTGSFLDSEDSVSDYQTPSEMSFQEEDMCDLQHKEMEKGSSGVSQENSLQDERPTKDSDAKSSPNELCEEPVYSTQKTDTDAATVEDAVERTELKVASVDDSLKSRHSTHTSALKSLWQSSISANKTSNGPSADSKHSSKPPMLDSRDDMEGAIFRDDASNAQSDLSLYSEHHSQDMDSGKDVLLDYEQENKMNEDSMNASLNRQNSDESATSIASGVKIRQRCKRKQLDGVYEVDTVSITSSVSGASDHGEASKNRKISKDCSVLNGGTKYSRVDIVYDHSKLPPLATCTCQEKPLRAEEHRSFEGRISCQALDSIDGKLVGCCNVVTTHQLVRPSVKIPFTAMCEVHLWRLSHHQCCPGCGIFCTQGNFLECIVTSNGKRQVHLFHKQCEVVKESHTTPLCPHCGMESEFQAVTLELNLPPSTTFFLSQKPSVPRARITFARLYGANADIEIVPSSTYKIVETGKVLSSSGLPPGPEKSHLELLLASLQGEKAPSLRNPIKNCYTPIKNGDVDKILHLLASGFDPNHKFEDSENEAPLHVAAKHGHLLIVHLLVQAGALVDQMDDRLYTPLMKAVESNQVPIISYLIRAGAQLDVKGEDGTSSLHIAARNGRADICKLLLDTGRISINITDEGGWTPLVWAAENKFEDVVKLLLQCGSDPNLRDTEENVALHWSAFSGSVAISQLFLDSGCDLTAVNEHGDTPLHIAARQDNYECVILFLARGADIEARNKEDKTPLCCCRTEGSETWMALNINRELKRLTAGRVHRTPKILHKDISRGKEQYPITCINDVDDVTPPSDFLYITENCETSAINIDRTITSLQSCRCEDFCTSQACTCSTISFKCWYDKEGKLLPEFNMLDPPMIFECNRACLCWKSCYNRVLQNGITCRLQLTRTSTKGWGVRTLKDIPKGTFICEYVGEIITDSEADQREDDSYLFDLDNRDGETYCLDARYYGNISRFINHLCEPNLVPVKVFVDHQDLSFPRIAFFSSRDIAAYEELGFDYGEKFWVIKYKWFTCGCGSPKCKYSKDTIQATLENYYRRMKEEQGEEENVVSVSGGTQPLPV